MPSTLHRLRNLPQRDQLALSHLCFADAIAKAMHRRLRGLVELDDLIQVGREALLHAAGRLDPGQPPTPYLRRWIRGALLHYIRDYVRLVKVPRTIHERRLVPLRHSSLDDPDGNGSSILEQLPDHRHLRATATDPDAPIPQAELERLIEALPAAQAAAVRLTLLEGGSLRTVAKRLQTSATTVQRHQRRGLQVLREQLLER